MICLEVDVNEERVCIAGVGESGVLHAMVGWVRADPDRVCGPHHHYVNTPRESLDLAVGGLAKGEFQDWVRRDLAVGDRIVVGVVDRTDPDPPASRKPESVATDAYFASQQAHKDHLLAELQQVERAMAESGAPQRCTFCRRVASRERVLVAAPDQRGNICADCARTVLQTIGA